MSKSRKLFKLAEWHSVEDSADYLSDVLEEKVTPAKILRLAIDGHLKLSVRIVKHLRAARCAFEQANFGRELNMLEAVPIADDYDFLLGVYDLPMIGKERELVWDLCREVGTSSEAEHVPILEHSSRDLFVRDLEGQLFTLRHLPSSEPVPEGFQYGIASDFSGHGNFVVRTEALMEFERSLNQEQNAVAKGELEPCQTTHLESESSNKSHNPELQEAANNLAERLKREGHRSPPRGKSRGSSSQARSGWGIGAVAVLNALSAANGSFACFRLGAPN